MEDKLPEIEIEIEKIEVRSNSRPLLACESTKKEVKHAKDYYSTHMVEYTPPSNRGSLSVEVLDFLKGKPWDDVALAYVHSLRPTSIRVTTGTVKLDARTWRVTVIVDDKDIIESITQEVEVGLPEGVAHGEALDAALEYGINSPQVKWYDDDEISHYYIGQDGYFKVKDDGTRILYPNSMKDKPDP